MAIIKVTFKDARVIIMSGLQMKLTDWFNVSSVSPVLQTSAASVKLQQKHNDQKGWTHRHTYNKNTQRHTSQVITSLLVCAPLNLRLNLLGSVNEARDPNCM